MELFDDNLVLPIVENEDTSSGETITQPFSPNDIKLSNPPMNLGDLIDMITYGWVDFKTDYQRAEDLWSEEKQSRLIESALLGLRLPAFYFEEVNKKHWRIIDGLQRCCAIRNYCVTQTLSLENLEFLDFNGRYYDNLSFELKRDIRMLPITVNLLNSGVPNKVKYILFKRLNTGGMELTPQEIRNAVFQGIAIDTVKRMAVNPQFLKSTGNKIPVKRMQDMDFVSRFIAFYLIGYENYFPDLENFINTAMERINESTYTDKQIDKMEEDFSKALSLAHNIFDDDAFRKREDMSASRRPINKAYFEVITTLFAKLSEDQCAHLLNNKEPFCKDLVDVMSTNKAYNNSFSGGTGRRDSVKRRFTIFQEVMSKYLSI